MAAAVITQVQANYITALQRNAQMVLQLNRAMNDLINLYNGAGLSGTFTDAEVQAICPWLTAALVGTYTANIETIQADLTSGIIQNMANCLGQTP